MPACPHCGHDADPASDECPLCGTPLPDGDAAARPPDGGPASPAGGPVPWEDPDLGFAAGIGRTWRESMFAPSTFFGRIRDEGTVARALLYFLLLTVAGSFFTVVWDAMGLTLPDLVGRVDAGSPAGAGPVASFVLTPFVALLALAVVAAVYHIGALMVAPERRGMGATARVVCYASSASLLAVVPVAGAPAGAVWSLVLQTVGLKEVHRTTIPRALFMIFWLWGAVFLAALVLSFVLGAAGGGGGALAGAAAAAGP